MQRAQRLTIWATIGAGLFVTGRFGQPATADESTDRPAAHSNNSHPGYQRDRTIGGGVQGTWPGYGYRALVPRYGGGHHLMPYPAPFSGQPQASGWFQRPYPYHLDYYRMRYHGSYEPYDGNLYGPPAVILPQTFVPPAFGYGLGPPWIVTPQESSREAPD